MVSPQAQAALNQATCVKEALAARGYQAKAEKTHCAQDTLFPLMSLLHKSSHQEEHSK